MFDIIQIIKYDAVIDELKEVYDNDENIVEVVEVVEEVEEKDEVDLIPYQCIYTNDDDTECNNPIFIGDYCILHKEQYDFFVIDLKLYISKIVKTIDHKVLKDKNRECKGWIKDIEEELEQLLGISKAEIKKLIISKNIEYSGEIDKIIDCIEKL